MTYCRIVKTCLWASAAVILAFAAPIEQRPDRLVTEGISYVIPPAHAVIGRPLTPLSYAGVARRTARRTARRVSGYCGYPPYPPCY
jgi:hypothetical protein